MINLISVFEKKIKNFLLKDKNFIENLKSQLDSTISVWGDKNRVHISENTSLVNTLINTSSGEVFIEKETFCGHNVSIITGTHYIDQKGIDRMKFPSSGRNIHIGKGVWLCSNSVLLGPCELGDNAVIAAGAVVLPGTLVMPNTIYAGIPAKKIREHITEEKENDLKGYKVIYGFHEEEFDNNGNFTHQWMSGRFAKIEINLDNYIEQDKHIFDRGGGGEEKSKQKIILNLKYINEMNDTKLIMTYDTEVVYTNILQERGTISIELRKEHNELLMGFEINQTWSPIDKGSSNDNRILGIAIEKIEIIIDRIKGI